MTEEQVRRIVAEVIGRVAARLGADGGRGSLLAVFTGATAGLDEALQQVRQLVLDGYRVSLVLSESAEQLYEKVLWEQLAGFPHVDRIDSGKWISALGVSCAVVAPLLSVNTLSKISLLIADSLPANIILHALFMGKKVILARDGADPIGKRRDAGGLNRGNPAIKGALLTHFRAAEDYGCIFTDVDELRDSVNLELAQVSISPAKQQHVEDGPVRSVISCSEKKVITAAEILRAHNLGKDLRLSSGALVTPLARELALRHGVALVKGQVS